VSARTRASRIASALALAVAVLGAPAGAASQDVRAGVEQLAQQIEPMLPQGRQVRIAVPPFCDQRGVTSDYGRFVADRLIVRLARNARLLPVERRFFAELARQLRVKRTDLDTPEGVRRLTAEYPVETIILGVLSEAGDLINLQARVIDIATFETLGVATVNVANDARARRFLEAGRE
jgi:TolB-like protein